MVVAQSPISGRTPLQPKNSSSTPSETNPKKKPNPNPNLGQSNKENVHPNELKTPTAKSKNVHTNELATPKSKPVKKEYFEICESLDVSLAEELSVIRKRLERVRIDKEKTDEMLRERALFLDSQIKEVVDRGVLQKHLEIEVDRLFRLKEIKLSCTSISPIRSLRQKVQANQIRLQQDQQAMNHTESSDGPQQEIIVEAES